MAELTRRDFIGTAGAAVAAGAGIAGAAGIAAGTATLVLADEATEGTWDREADVVVVGSGGAGMMACVSAHNAGCSSLLLEKGGIAGGDSLLCHQDILAFWPQRTLEDSGVADTYESYLADWKSSHPFSAKGLRGDPEPDELPFCEHFMRNFPDVGDWLVNEAGVEFEPIIMGASMAIQYTFEPRSWHATNGAVVDNVLAVLQGWDDFELALNTEASRLILDGEGHVAGVSAIGPDGSVVRIGARRGVVLATGTFNANPSMISRYVDPVFAKFTSCGCINNTGDGIKMVQEIGGALVDMDLGLNWENAPVGTNDIWLLDNYMGNFSANEGAIALNDPAICVNLEGRRYMNESLGYNGMGRETAKQEYGLGFYLCDSTLSNEFLEGCDVVLWADTLEELADKLCVADPQVLVDEVARYNGFVDAGVDEDFGKNVEGCTRIEKAPFYALVIKPTHYVTLGGISTDVNSHVLDTEGAPIPGLYAAGMCCGSYWEQEGVLYYGGFDQALAFGWQAGRNAAEQA